MTSAGLASVPKTAIHAQAAAPKGQGKAGALPLMGALEDKIAPFGIPHWNHQKDAGMSVVPQSIVELNALAQFNNQRQQLPRVKEKAQTLAEGKGQKCESC